MSKKELVKISRAVALPPPKSAYVTIPADAAKSRERPCLPLHKQLALITVAQNVLLIVIARAWADLLGEIIMPVMIDESLAPRDECGDDAELFGIVLFMGAFCSFLASRSKGAITALVPGAVGLMCSSTLTPSVLKCRETGLALLSTSNLSILLPPYVTFGILYLLGALLRAHAVPA